MGSRGKALGQRSEGLGHFIFSDTNFLTKLSHKLGIIRLKIFFSSSEESKVRCQNGWGHGPIVPSGSAPVCMQVFLRKVKGVMTSNIEEMLCLPLETNPRRSFFGLGCRFNIPIPRGKCPLLTI